ncbi:MAG: 8-oxo-dGTP pyrophosphatase MutT (NUDIX family) [Paracoccaceae bacterium]|jgi:8-oxo-dGTP pyrophosphatase MutT (NUDIX family)
MTSSPLTIDLLRLAVAGPASGPSSDWDMNPSLRDAIVRPGPMRAAAVLCPVVERDGVLRVILTRRADHLNAHAGQVAFPGGKRDPSDPSLADAALREAEEEIGLPRAMVRMLGRIDGHETGTGFAITPFVGLVDPAFVARPDPSEVAEVFEPPLSFLMDPARRRRETREWQGISRQFYAIPWEGRYIWGATARILVSLAERVAAAQRLHGAPADGDAIAEMLRPADGLRVAPDPRVARGPLEGKAAD